MNLGIYGLPPGEAPAKELLGFLHVREEQAAGTPSADTTISTGAGTTRTLNTVKLNTLAGASLASNAITLTAPGTYEIFARAPMSGALTITAYPHQASLFDGTANVIVGSSAQTITESNFNQTDSVIIGRFTITSTKTLTILHKAGVTAGQGGRLVNAGQVNVFTDVILKRVA